MSNFSLEEANNMAINQCREYITKYFYPLNTSQHVMVSYDEDGKPVYEIKKIRLLKKFISTDYRKMYAIIILRNMTKLGA